MSLAVLAIKVSTVHRGSGNIYFLTMSEEVHKVSIQKKE